MAPPRNVGAGHRVRRSSPSDDDTYWLPGSLERARELLESYPRSGVLNARVLVGPEQLEDKTCRRMAGARCPRRGCNRPDRLPRAAFRRSAFLRAGGYGQGSSSARKKGCALDLMTLGFAIVYAPALVVVIFRRTSTAARAARSWRATDLLDGVAAPIPRAARPRRSRSRRTPPRWRRRSARSSNVTPASRGLGYRRSAATCRGAMQARR